MAAVTVMVKSVADVVTVVAKNAVAFGSRNGVARTVEMPADWTVVLDGVATSVLWFTILKLVLTCPRRSCPA